MDENEDILTFVLEKDDETPKRRQKKSARKSNDNEPAPEDEEQPTDEPEDQDVEEPEEPEEEPEEPEEEPEEPTVPPPRRKPPSKPSQKPIKPKIKPDKPPEKAMRLTGLTKRLYQGLATDTKDMVREIGRAGRDYVMVRIRYSPKVTTGTAVYRTLCPYSLRARAIHTRGYDKPPVRTIVFFGYDAYKGTIKMFVADRILSVQRMRRMFEPYWDVEFGEAVQEFERRLDEGSLDIEGEIAVFPNKTGTFLDVYGFPDELWQRCFLRKQLQPPHWIDGSKARAGHGGVGAESVQFKKAVTKTVADDGKTYHVVERSGWASRPLSRSNAVQLRQKMQLSGHSCKIVPANRMTNKDAEKAAEALIAGETTTAACVGAYEVPLGTKPPGQKKAKKKRKKRRRDGS